MKGRSIGSDVPVYNNVKSNHYQIYNAKVRNNALMQKVP